MKTILIIKLLAIGITVYCIIRNDERTINFLGWSLIATFSMSFWTTGVLPTTGLVIYLLTIATVIVLVIAKKISIPNRNPLILFLIAALINGTSQLLQIPNYAVLYILAIGSILLYIYFLLKHKSVNVLIIASIPVVDSILILSKLGN